MMQLERLIEANKFHESKWVLELAKIDLFSNHTNLLMQVKFEGERSSLSEAYANNNISIPNSTVPPAAAAIAVKNDASAPLANTTALTASQTHTPVIPTTNENTANGNRINRLQSYNISGSKPTINFFEKVLKRDNFQAPVFVKKEVVKRQVKSRYMSPKSQRQNQEATAATLSKPSTPPKPAPLEGFAKTVYSVLLQEDPEFSHAEFEPWDQRHDLFLRAQNLLNSTPVQYEGGALHHSHHHHHQDSLLLDLKRVAPPNSGTSFSGPSLTSSLLTPSLGVGMHSDYNRQGHGSSGNTRTATGTPLSRNSNIKKSLLLADTRQGGGRKTASSRKKNDKEPDENRLPHIHFSMYHDTEDEEYNNELLGSIIKITQESLLSPSPVYSINSPSHYQGGGGGSINSSQAPTRKHSARTVTSKVSENLHDDNRSVSSENRYAGSISTSTAAAAIVHLRTNTEEEDVIDNDANGNYWYSTHSSDTESMETRSAPYVYEGERVQEESRNAHNQTQQHHQSFAGATKHQQTEFGHRVEKGLSQPLEPPSHAAAVSTTDEERGGGRPLNSRQSPDMVAKLRDIYHSIDLVHNEEKEEEEDEENTRDLISRGMYRVYGDIKKSGKLIRFKSSPDSNKKRAMMPSEFKNQRLVYTTPQQHMSRSQSAHKAKGGGGVGGVIGNHHSTSITRSFKSASIYETDTISLAAEHSISKTNNNNTPRKSSHAAARKVKSANAQSASLSLSINSNSSASAREEQLIRRPRDVAQIPLNELKKMFPPLEKFSRKKRAPGAGGHGFDMPPPDIIPVVNLFDTTSYTHPLLNKHGEARLKKVRERELCIIILLFVLTTSLLIGR